MDTEKSEHCPVCGYNLGFSPWEGPSASDEICPCCFIQFGYDDFTEGDASARQGIYDDWRRLWIDEGMKWHSKGRQPPYNWNPVEQLRAIGAKNESFCHSERSEESLFLFARVNRERFLASLGMTKPSAGAA
jgi:hypothetical protein